MLTVPKRSQYPTRAHRCVVGSKRTLRSSWQRNFGISLSPRSDSDPQIWAPRSDTLALVQQSGRAPSRDTTLCARASDVWRCVSNQNAMPHCEKSPTSSTTLAGSDFIDASQRIVHQRLQTTSTFFAYKRILQLDFVQARCNSSNLQWPQIGTPSIRSRSSSRPLLKLDTPRMTGKDLEVGNRSSEAYTTPKLDESLLLGGEDKPTRGASILTLLLISMPRMAIQMTWSAQWAALGPYLGTMLPKYAVQLTQVIGPTTGILVAPTVGVFSDRSTNPWGRRRPFIFIASITSVICWILMGFTRELGEALGDYGSGKEGEETHRPWTAFFTVFFYTWMDITVNAVQTPMFLMIADFAGERQTTGAAIGQGWSTIGSILVAGYIYIFGAAHKTLKSFLGLLSVIMVVTVIIACIAGKETPLKKDENNSSSSWDQIKSAFGSIIQGIKTLPSPLIAYCIIFFCVQYGFTAYSGNKGQFFGFEVYNGEATGADACGDDCTKAQDDYNHGVSVAGGSTDLIFNIVGYLFSWAIPFLVMRFGAKWVLVVGLIPQSLLMVMAFTKVVAIDVLIVVSITFSQTIVFALLVPIIVHVFGTDADIGMYVGALNSAQCFGQLLNFIIGAALVETSMGYKLPVFIGGVMSFIGVIIGIFFLKIKMHML
ncbi:Sucrose transport protein sut1, partial [Globisporangium splendens]